MMTFSQSTKSQLTHLNRSPYQTRKVGVVKINFWCGAKWKALLAIDLFFPETKFVVMGNRSLRNHGLAFLWTK